MNKVAIDRALLPNLSIKECFRACSTAMKLKYDSRCTTLYVGYCEYDHIANQVLTWCHKDKKDFVWGVHLKVVDKMSFMEVTDE